jgi:hypothetical protein
MIRGTYSKYPIIALETKQDCFVVNRAAMHNYSQSRRTERRTTKHIIGRLSSVCVAEQRSFNNLPIIFTDYDATVAFIALRSFLQHEIIEDGSTLALLGEKYAQLLYAGIVLLDQASERIKGQEPINFFEQSNITQLTT